MSDLISREAAIDIADDLRACISVEGYLAWTERLKKLPSAQPETPPYVAEIESEYKKWVSIPYIKKPLAKALYEVWKKHDIEDVSRNG